MLILGIIIFGFLALHMFQFWAKMQLVEVFGEKGSEAYILASQGAYWIDFWFSKPWVSVTYIICFIALWFHLTHGIWSSLHSIGLNNKTWLPRLKMISNIAATVIMLLFAVIPIYFLLGFRFVVPM
jgi:succinate dehydrogenase / fumarate reductase cytochrome b subunit